MTGARTPSMRFALAMSVDLRAARLHDRRPARELCLEHRGHLLRRAGNEVVAEVGHALDEVRGLGGLQRRGIELDDDLARRARRHREPEPDAGLVAGYARLGERRQIG